MQVADVAGLLTPDPISLAIHSAKLAAKAGGAYSARGGKLKEFSRDLQETAEYLEATAGRTKDNPAAVPILKKLHELLQLAASKLEKYQKRGAMQGLWKAGSENERIESIRAEIRRLFCQLKAVGVELVEPEMTESTPGSASNGPLPGATLGVGMAGAAAVASLAGVPDLMQPAAPGLDLGGYGSAYVGLLSGLTQAAAGQQQAEAMKMQSLANLEQLTQQAEAMKMQSLANLEQLTQQAEAMKMQSLANLEQQVQEAQVMREHYLQQMKAYNPYLQYL